MHHAWVGRCIGYAGLLGDRQGVDIRPQANSVVAITPMDDRDHTGPIKIVQGVHAERPKPLLDERAGPGFSEAEFGMCVQIPAPANHLLVIALYFVEHRHYSTSSLGCLWHTLPP